MREEPILLLESIEGAQYVALPEADRCCGFGGAFMAKMPEVSMSLADEKAQNIVGVGADMVTTFDGRAIGDAARAGSNFATQRATGRGSTSAPARP